MFKKKTLIIAEAGVNHNGNLKIAKKLIDAAKKCGADYVKFQTFDQLNYYSRNRSCTLSKKNKIR